MRKLFLNLCVFLGLWTACASIFAEEVPAEIEPPLVVESNVTNKLSTSMQELMLRAISLSGIKYKFGGSSPETGFDCSGFVRYVFQQAANLTLPHGARALSQLGQTVTQENLQPGDLVFFNTLKSSFSHVGIYLGNHRFIHSPSAGKAVSVMDMSDSYWAQRFNGARRITSTKGGAESIKELSQPTPAE